MRQLYRTGFLFGAAISLLLGNVTAQAANSMQISQELDAEYGYVGSAGASGSKFKAGDVTENSSDLKYVVSPQVTRDLLLRFGVEWQRYSFDTTRSAAIPGVLQQVSAVIGCDYQLADQWLARLEIEPGVYSDFDHVTGKSIDFPLVIGGAYLVSADLQWFFGLRVDIQSQYPVLPAAGVRWRFADDWTLNFQLPHPKLEYEFNPKAHAYFGFELQANTFRVSDKFGTDHGSPKLDNAVMDYFEARIGPGFQWKCTPQVTLSIDGGYVPYREWNFHRADTELRSHGGFYGEITCNAAF